MLLKLWIFISHDFNKNLLLCNFSDFLYQLFLIDMVENTDAPFVIVLGINTRIILD